MLEGRFAVFFFRYNKLHHLYIGCLCFHHSWPAAQPPKTAVSTDQIALTELAQPQPKPWTLTSSKPSPSRQSSCESLARAKLAALRSDQLQPSPHLQICTADTMQVLASLLGVGLCPGMPRLNTSTSSAISVSRHRRLCCSPAHAADAGSSPAPSVCACTRLCCGCDWSLLCDLPDTKVCFTEKQR